MMAWSLIKRPKWRDSLASMPPVVAVYVGVAVTHKAYDHLSTSETIVDNCAVMAVFMICLAFPMALLFKAFANLSCWRLPDGLRFVSFALSGVCSVYLVGKLASVIFMLTSTLVSQSCSWLTCDNQWNQASCCPVRQPSCNSTLLLPQHHNSLTADSLTQYWLFRVHNLDTAASVDVAASSSRGVNWRLISASTVVWIGTGMSICLGQHRLARLTLGLLVGGSLAAITIVGYLWSRSPASTGLSRYGKMTGLSSTNSGPHDGAFFFLLHMYSFAAGPLMARKAFSSCSALAIASATAISTCLLLLHDSIYSLATGVLTAGSDSSWQPSGALLGPGVLVVPLRAFALLPSPSLLSAILLTGLLCFLTAGQLSLGACLMDFIVDAAGLDDTRARHVAALSLSGVGAAVSAVAALLDSHRLVDFFFYNSVSAFGLIFTLLGVMVAAYDFGYRRLMRLAETIGCGKRLMPYFHHAWRHLALAVVLLVATSEIAQHFSSLIRIHAFSQLSQDDGIAYIAGVLIAAAPVCLVIAVAAWKVGSSRGGSVEEAEKF